MKKAKIENYTEPKNEVNQSKDFLDFACEFFKSIKNKVEA